MGNNFMWFRTLNKKEELEFRLWARNNYIVGMPIDELWHPVVRQECEAMNDADELVETEVE